MMSIRKWVTSWVSSDVFAWVLLAMPLLGMLLLTGLDFRLVRDEALYHIKVIDQFAGTPLLTAIADYPSASTPLPYLIWALYGKVVGFDVWKLRLLTAVVTYLTAVLFCIVCKRQGLPYPLVSTLTLIGMPYVFFYGHTFYTISFGMFFCVLALHFYLQQDLKHWLWGALFAGCAIYSRQYYLSLPLGMLLYRLVANRRQLIPDLRHNFGHWIAAGLPILTILPLFWLWKGMVPPLHQADHFVYPVAQHVNFFFIFVGFYFWPMIVSARALQTLREKAIVCCVILVVLLPLYAAFRLTYSENYNAIGVANGLLVHGFDIVGNRLGDWAAEAAKFGVWLVGLAIILAAVFDMPWEDAKYKLMALWAAFLAMIIMTPYVAERYYVLPLPYLILLLHKPFRKWQLLTGWAIVLVCLSIGFTYLQIVLKPFEGW
ncbi:MAG: glycosyltransferase family 39 protein [Anaerolineae bacterium]|nr:glycosyltransferase family 39 protein [Anaerolineae bacterium]